MSDGVTDRDPANIIGGIPYIHVGATFASRKELAEARVHPPLEHGVYRGPGGTDEPAKSIVMANRPEYPNEDYGERFTYIGMGGHDGPEDEEEEGGLGKGDKTGRKKKRRNTHGGLQTSHQSFRHPMNKALKVAAELGTLVRVTRGAGASAFAPYTGYRYDGLYYVENPRLEVGPTGVFNVCKFDFVRESDRIQGPLPRDRGPEPQQSGSQQETQPRSPRVQQQNTSGNQTQTQSGSRRR